MNFYFELGDIVVFRTDPSGLDLYILVKGFDPIPSGFRVWWADQYVAGVANPNKRRRVFTKDMIRIRRPSEEIRLAERAARWKERRIIASFTRRAREELKRRAALRKRGIVLNDLPFNIPSGKWVSPEGVREILTDMGFKPETIEKRVRIMERIFGK
jgi:hypothetical protein